MAIKSAKSSGVKVLPVRWISVWRQAVSILRASGFSPSLCGTSCGAVQRAGLPVRLILCLSLSVCAQEIYFREPACPWVRTPPLKFHERTVFSFPTFLPLSLSREASQPADGLGIEPTFTGNQAQSQAILGHQTWQTLSGKFPSSEPLFPILFESNYSALRRAVSSMRKRPSSVILNTAAHPCRPSPPTGREGAFPTSRALAPKTMRIIVAQQAWRGGLAA